jgi:hypothetical protein
VIRITAAGKCMTQKISAIEAERLSETPTTAEDAEFLKRLYAQQAFVMGNSIQDNQAKAPRLSDPEIVEQYRSFMTKAYPEIVLTIDDAKVIANYREHESSASEILGDYPRKLKKWAIFVLSDYAPAIADKVFFAAFRLDELNACAIKLPSSASAVVINTSFVAIIPVLLSAFLDIYEVGTAEEGVFKVQQSDNSRAILEMARCFARSDFNALLTVTKRVRLRSDAFDSSFKVQLLAALHECAHLVLGHLDIAKEIQRSVNGLSADSWMYTQPLEHEADSFAVRHLLNLDTPVTKRWTFEIAVVCTILYGFGHLVSLYSTNGTASHPKFTYRWTNVRSQFVDAMGSEVIVKRLEGIIEALTAMQNFGL